MSAVGGFITYGAIRGLGPLLRPTALIIFTKRDFYAINFNVLWDYRLHVLYFRDNQQHKTPHIHARYQGYEVVIAIPDGDILEGDIPKAKMKLLQAWIELRKDELVADWEVSVHPPPPFPESVAL